MQNLLLQTLAVIISQKSWGGKNYHENKFAHFS
jgi:hypothetical protein